MDLTQFNAGDATFILLNIENLNSNEILPKAKDFCTDADYQRLLTFESEQRLREFFAVRYILWIEGITQDFYYHGKVPKLKSGVHISISHAQDWVVVALSSKYRVGVDVERFRDQVKSICEKFVHPKDENFFNIDSVSDLTVLWSFKETVYKLAQIPGLSLTQEIHIQGSDTYGYMAHVFTQDVNFRVPLGFKIMDNYVLTFNTGDVQQ